MTKASDISPQQRQAEERARAFFERANEAGQKSNFDYAIKLYQDALKLTPGNLAIRQALRYVQRKRFDNEPAKVGRLIGVRIQPIRMRAKKAKLQHQWAHVLDLCEEAFTLNPWDTEAAKDGSEAAEHLGHPAVAEWLIESVLTQAGDDVHFLRFAAHAYEVNQSWQKAIQCWEKVKKLAPNDESASRQINALSASAAIARSGLHESIHKASEGRAGPESFTPDPEELKNLAMAPEQRWLKEIEANPERIGPYLELADHFRMRNQLDEAEKALARGLKAVPKDAVLLMAHAEVQISRLHKAIADWTKVAQQRPDDDAARDKVEKLTTMLNDYEIKEFRRRLDLRPDDMNLHLQVGMRLAKAGRHDEAIAAFQQARNTPDLKVHALLQAGLSFEANGVMKLAERSYNEALKAADPNDTPVLNELNYRLGRAFEAMGKDREAEEHYNEVAANDYSFLDVAQRLRALNQRRGS
ncbi:MAG TPA: tetratricopeptide repeat protein [Isosphaeraceae bacterium]|jgi:tetratricopeptide (TPR) repeat protein|nr:tetratricopeptide repeat protein [Isosphaeraceae bacterium]